MSLKPALDATFETHVPVVIIGAGAAGLCAALSAVEHGADVVILEREAKVSGSTGLSAGLIPAAGTRFQQAAGIDDSPQLFAADIQRKAHGENASSHVQIMSEGAAPAIEWLADQYNLPFSLVDDFDYPGHSARRMHGLPSRSGQELVDRLRAAVEAKGIPILLKAPVTSLFADSGRKITGIEITRPDGSQEQIGCDTLILACNGYGGSKALLEKHIPQMSRAIYFGHVGNQGDALLWGEALGAKLVHLSAYQGHGSVAQPQGVLITWALMMEGGFQVNLDGKRFSNETLGYSEQAEIVMQQSGQVAWCIFNERIARVARQFEDFRNAEAAGAVLGNETAEGLARQLKLPESVNGVDRVDANSFIETMSGFQALSSLESTDVLGRKYSGRPFDPPFKAVRVTGALFHTQGGLAVDGHSKVLDADGRTLPNLFATGGAAVGISGSSASGYLSGNGLVTAVVLGRLAGAAAASLALKKSRNHREKRGHNVKSQKTA